MITRSSSNSTWRCDTRVRFDSPRARSDTHLTNTLRLLLSLSRSLALLASSLSRPLSRALSASRPRVLALLIILALTLALALDRRDLAARMRVCKGRRVALCDYCEHAGCVEWLRRPRSPVVRRVHWHQPERVQSRGANLALSHRSRLRSFPPFVTTGVLIPQGPKLERSLGRPCSSQGGACVS